VSIPVIQTYTFHYPQSDDYPRAASCVGTDPFSFEDGLVAVNAARNAEVEDKGVAPFPQPLGLNRERLEFPTLPTRDPVEGVRHVLSAYNNCARCHLCSTRMRVVHERGDAQSAILLLGEGPGRAENDQGQPFVGRAGRLQNEILTDAGLDPNALYWMNALGCRPATHWQKDRPPTEAELLACSERVYLMLQAIRPRVVVCLGKTATRYFFEEPPSPWGFTRFVPRGSPDDWVMVAHARHPAYLARVIGVASMYKEYAAQRTFYRLLASQAPGLTKVNAWHFLPHQLSNPPEEVMTAWHTK